MRICPAAILIFAINAVNAKRSIIPLRDDYYTQIISQVYSKYNQVLKLLLIKV